MKKALIIFIKNPVLGKVKTRIAATMGDENALKIYKILLTHTREITEKIAVEKFLFYSDFIDENDEYEGTIFNKELQDSSPDLGKKMFVAFTFLKQKGLQKIIIIGSDCYDLNADILNNAFKTLESKDAIIGPAKDGGYYAIGFNFENIQSDFDLEMMFLNRKWSHQNVAKEAVEIFEKYDLDYGLMPMLSDVDIAFDTIGLTY